jgi:hypothetical protein
MRKYLLFITAFCFGLFSSQSAKPSLGINVVNVIPTGNNYLKDGVKNFIGVGLTFQTIFRNNMGFGVELSRAFSEVKDISIYGDLDNPQLTNISVYFVYKYPLTEAFNLEGQIGLGLLALTSQSRYTQDKYTENASAFQLGSEISYKFPKAKKVEIYASPKIYFFDSLVGFQEKDLDRYYSRSLLLNINVGVRINFNEK